MHCNNAPAWRTEQPSAGTLFPVLDKPFTGKRGVLR